MRETLKNALIETEDDVANKDGHGLVNILKQGGVTEVTFAGEVVSMLSGISIVILRIAETIGEDPLDLVEAVRLGTKAVGSLEGFYENEELKGFYTSE
ncbi:MAG: hypothetical protein IJG86_00255 [Clostridia bacterium]|nr:hypothetical protein [Clostridia bacterium]